MNPLQKAMQEINRKYKTDIIQQGTEMVYVEKIPFSSPRANYLSYGGIPIGKATEFFGSEGGGKTTSALDIASQAQRLAKAKYDADLDALNSNIESIESKDSPSKSDSDRLKKLIEQRESIIDAGWRKVVYIDAENTLDVVWAEKLGVDTQDLILMRPQDQTAEQILQMMLDLIDTGQIILMVLDSVPMLVSQNLYEESLEKKSYGGIAGAVTEFCRKVSSKISQHKTALLLINQVRENFENPYDQHKTAGGKALKHLYALRLYFKKGSFIDENHNEQPQRYDSPFGNLVDIQMVKTKVCKPDRRIGQYTLSYYNGIDVEYDTLFMAVKYGLVIQSGAWYEVVMTGERLQGKSKVLDYLKQNPSIFDEIYADVQSKVTVEN